MKSFQCDRVMFLCVCVCMSLNEALENDMVSFKWICYGQRALGNGGRFLREAETRRLNPRGRRSLFTFLHGELIYVSIFYQRP